MRVLGLAIALALALGPPTQSDSEALYMLNTVAVPPARIATMTVELANNFLSRGRGLKALSEIA
jgi:hypothetical protein